MDLPSIVNAPRELALGGVTYRARALTLGQLGEVLAWLDDRLPAEPGRAGPPPLSGGPARLALATTEGLAVVLHLALASCHPDLSRDDARGLAATMSPEDESRLLAVAFRRLPGASGRGEARDLAEVAWGELFEHLTGHRADAYEGAARLTLDQLDNWLRRGETEAPGSLTPAEVQAMWDAAPGPRAAGDPPLTEVTDAR